MTTGSTTDGLAEACEELLDLLAQLDVVEVRNGRAYAGLVTKDVLLADRDVQLVARRGTGYESKCPWNESVATVLLDTHELVRRLESALRLMVTGNPGPRRGGSAGNTIIALRNIPRLAEAVDYHDRRQAARMVYRCTRRIGQLPAIDSIPRWERIRSGPGGIPPRCENCKTYSLRLEIGSGKVVCAYPSCTGLDGYPPQGRLEISRLTGDAILCWRDGTVQGAPPAAHIQADEPTAPEPVNDPGVVI